MDVVIRLDLYSISDFLILAMIISCPHLSFSTFPLSQMTLKTDLSLNCQIGLNLFTNQVHEDDKLLHFDLWLITRIWIWFLPFARLCCTQSHKLFRHLHKTISHPSVGMRSNDPLVLFYHHPTYDIIWTLLCKGDWFSKMALRIYL